MKNVLMFWLFFIRLAIVATVLTAILLITAFELPPWGYFTLWGSIAFVGISIRVYYTTK
jgi:hypothetical protein